MWIQIFFIPN